MANRLHILALFLLSFVMLSSTAFSLTVKKVRLGQHGEMTRVVLESDKAIRPDHFSLQTPPRFVLDFDHADFKVSVDAVEKPESSLVKGLRQGLFKPRVTRMVVDLEKPAVASVFNIPASKGKGHRLVIDLKPATQKQISKQIAATKKRFKAKKPVPEMHAVTKKKNDEFVIVLDPGHGGVDPGAIGKKKTYEKHVVLQIAKKLKRELSRIDGVKVYLTRDKDIFVPLKDRVAFAQRKHADLFVSIHADAHNNRRIKGGSVYVLSERSSDKEARRLARIANRGDMVAGVHMKDESKSVQNILIDLAQRETKNKSAMLANDILSVMKKSIPVKRDTVAFAGFRVLKAPEIPSVLVETTYISNVGEEKKLRRKDHQERIARSIAQGVEKYIKTHRYN